MSDQNISDVSLRSYTHAKRPQMEYELNCPARVSNHTIEDYPVCPYCGWTFGTRATEWLPLPQAAPAEDKIRKACNELADFLVEKNRKYGNSALEPVRIFSRSDVLEQLRVRIDDKLSRVRSAQLDEDEDVINDLLGYFILYRVARDDC